MRVRPDERAGEDEKTIDRTGGRTWADPVARRSRNL